MLTIAYLILFLQYAAWDDSQRWVLLEYVLKNLTDVQLNTIFELLRLIVPPPDLDFTRVLPRQLCIQIFSYLDPQSLCRAGQVSGIFFI